jgi:hypothetical protein
VVAITDVRLETSGNSKRLVGRVAGHELWYEVYGDTPVEQRGEPFFGIALLLAMSRHEAITVDPGAPVSSDFLRSLWAVQRVFRQWNPGFAVVDVDATIADLPRLNDGALCSFSGGVDSMHTFLEHESEITHLLTIGGYDYVTGPKTDFDAVRAKIGAFARQFGKTLVAVDTNTRAVCDALKMKWTYAQGPILCALAVGLGFDTYIMPANHSYRDLKPWGSHPIVDPLWSTARTQVRHLGCDAYRTEKTAHIAAHPEALRYLQVCWHSQAENCGHCSKCVRTALVLQLLGVKDYPIPCDDPLSRVDSFEARNDFSASSVWDTMRLARERGARDVEQALKKTLRRYIVRRSAASVANAVLSPKLLDLVRKRNWTDRSVLLTDPSDFK